MPPIADTGYLFDHVASVLHRQIDQILQERLGIGLSQFKMLALIEWRPGVTQRELANNLGQTEASISRQIGVLVNKGLLVSHVDPAERRRHLAALSTKGAKLLLAAHEVLATAYEPMFAHLNPREKEQLQKVLARLHEYTCAPGKRIACDTSGDIETMYAHQPKH